MEDAPVIVFIDDQDLPGTYMKIASKKQLKEKNISIPFKFKSFRDEDLAIEYIIRNHSKIVAISQDTNRRIGKIIKGWQKTSRKNYYDIGVFGICGAFHSYVIDSFCPEAISVLSGAYYSDHEYSIIKKWAEIDSSILYMPKPVLLDKIDLMIEKAIKVWENRYNTQEIPNDQKLVSLLNEELSVLFSKQPNFIDDLTPRRFEEFIQSIFKNHGFNVELTQQTRDGGYDLKLCENVKLENNIVLVEVKHTNPLRPVNVGIVRALYGVKALNKANKAILATSSFVSDYAKREFSRVIPMELEFIERNDIIAWCKKYYSDLFK